MICVACCRVPSVRVPQTKRARLGRPARIKTTLTRAEQTRAEKLGGKMVQNRPKRTNSRAKMVQNRPKWSKTGQNIPKWSKTGQGPYTYVCYTHVSVSSTPQSRAARPGQGPCARRSCAATRPGRVLGRPAASVHFASARRSTKGEGMKIGMSSKSSAKIPRKR